MHISRNSDSDISVLSCVLCVMYCSGGRILISSESATCYMLQLLTSIHHMYQDVISEHLQASTRVLHLLLRVTDERTANQRVA